MPVWVIQLILAAIPLVGKLIDKLLPEKHTPTLKRWNRKCTIESIANYGKRKGIV